jgi:tRNA(Ile)-lysidine synthase
MKLHIAHMNHGLRGAESDEDARSVLETCDHLGVPATVGAADVQGVRSRYRLSLEAAAREARYDFLARVSASIGASAVATGHTADDQAETVLMHLLRGTGIRGLRGMLPVSRWRTRDGSGEVAVVRPLLQATRREIESYCSALGLEPRHDSSNLEARFTRNRIRRHLMPRLLRYNPAAREAITRLATTVASDVAFIDQQVQEKWPSLVVEEAHGLRLRRDAFTKLHPSLQAHLLYRVYGEVVGEATELNLAQIEGMLRLARAGAGRSLSLGHGARFFTSYEELLVTRRAPEAPWTALEDQSLPVHGDLRTNGWLIRVQRRPASNPAQSLLDLGPFCARLDASAVGESLSLRSRSSGDRFHPLGAGGAKKLKAFMIDAHIPQHWREGVPLVVGSKGIAWVVGWRIAHWARVTEGTREVVEVSFSRA